MQGGFNENGNSSVILVDCRVYGPLSVYVYFVDVYDMYTLPWVCVHFLSVSDFGAVSSFLMFCFVKDDKKETWGILICTF